MVEQTIVTALFVIALLGGIISIFINVIIADGIFLAMLVSGFFYTKCGLHMAISLLIALGIAIALPLIFAQFRVAFFIITGLASVVAGVLAFDLARTLNLDTTWKVVFVIIGVVVSLGTHFASKESFEETTISLKIEKY